MESTLQRAEDLSDRDDYRLPTVRQLTRSIGKEAVSLHMKLTQGKKTNVWRVLNSKLVIWESSGTKKSALAVDRSPKLVARRVA